MGENIGRAGEIGANFEAQRQKAYRDASAGDEMAHKLEVTHKKGLAPSGDIFTGVGR